MSEFKNLQIFLENYLTSKNVNKEISKNCVGIKLYSVII